MHAPCGLVWLRRFRAEHVSGGARCRREVLLLRRASVSVGRPAQGLVAARLAPSGDEGVCVPLRHHEVRRRAFRVLRHAGGAAGISAAGAPAVAEASAGTGVPCDVRRFARGGVRARRSEADAGPRACVRARTQGTGGEDVREVAKRACLQDGREPRPAAGDGLALGEAGMAERCADGLAVDGRVPRKRQDYGQRTVLALVVGTQSALRRGGRHAARQLGAAFD